MKCGTYQRDVFFFFNDTATTEIYTLSLHDALPISEARPTSPARTTPTSTTAATCRRASSAAATSASVCASTAWARWSTGSRSEEHTSELQSCQYLVCRLLLEKKKRYLR